MTKSPAKIQAALALGFALLLWACWAAFGTPLRVRWLVSRGAPPAAEEASAEAVEAIRAQGVAARGTLLSILHGGSVRARKSWVAGILLRTPFFAKAEVEAALSSPDPSTRRAAVYALMEGEAEAQEPGVEGAKVLPASPVAAPPGKGASPDAWDPAPALPILLEWAGDRADLESRFAVRLLGRFPPPNDAVKEALLRVVEEARTILGPEGSGDLQLRKFAVVNALSALRPWAASDPSVVERVSKVVAWIEDEKLSDAGWDLQAYALGLVEAAGGRGADPALLERLSRSPAPVLRQRLANSLAAVPGDGARAVLEHLLFDETATVRRSAVLTLMKRREPRLLDLLPVLLEDCYIYIRSDAVRAVGELRGTEAARCRALVPVLVSCLEHPWEGEPAAPGTPLAGFQRAGMVDVVESAALALWQVAGDAPGFLRRDPATGKEINDLLDWKKRGEIARRLVEDGEARAAIVAQWRERTDPPPADLRTGALVRRMLEDRDPENVVRAMRELQRLTGDATGFPPAALRRKDDDTEARNAVREWWKADGRAKARPAWEARAGGPR